VRKAGSKDRLEFPIGKVLYETSNEILSVRFSPGGDRLALSANSEGILTVDLSGKVTNLTKSESANVAWRPDGAEVWFGG